MSRPISQAMQAALAAVRGGMSQYAAAKQFGVHQSGLSQQLNKQPPKLCEHCGHKI